MTLQEVIFELIQMGFEVKKSAWRYQAKSGSKKLLVLDQQESGVKVGCVDTYSISGSFLTGPFPADEFFKIYKPQQYVKAKRQKSSDENAKAAA
jgi:hypothetical protein